MKSLKIIAASMLLGAAGIASAGTIVYNGTVETLCENPTIDLDAGEIVANTDCGSGGGTAPTVSLSASPSSLDEGGTVTVSWNVSAAESCTATGGDGGWAGSSIGNGSGSSSHVMNTAGTYSFRLSCTGDGLTTALSRSVTVNDPAAGGGGGGDTGPENCPDPVLAGDVKNFEAEFGEKWPEPAAYTERVDLPRGRYLALKINTADAAAVRAVEGEIENAFYSGSQDNRVIQISQCPGDFVETNVDYACRKGITTSGSLRWALGNDGRFLTCDLEEDTTYYINIAFISTSDITNRTCSNSTCRTLLKSLYSR